MQGLAFDDVVVHPACSLPAGHSAPPFTSSFARLPRSVAPDGYVTAFYYLLVVGALGVPLILPARTLTIPRTRTRTRTSLPLILAALTLT